MDNIEKINQLIKEADNYNFKNNCYSVEHGTYSRASVEMQAWIAECEDFIISTYGEESVPWKVFSRFNRDELDGYDQDTFDKQRNTIVSALSACLRINPKNSETTKNVSSKSNSKKLTQIFIVHGHDEEAKFKVARFIEKLGFEPIILHEQASSGSTIIEKIEEYSNVGFGIVLYTPCDIGGKKADSPELKSRARQNVVFEHGYLIAKIGRNNVCALVRGDIETPTDVSGIVYISMDNSNAWHIEVARELRNSGYNVDMNKVL